MRNESRRRRCFAWSLAWLCAGCAGPATELPGADEWSLIPELRIGSLNDDRYAFSPIVDLTVGPDGNLFVTQLQVPYVSVYDRRGEFRGRFGRRGSGPGEFLAAGRMGWRADTLWVGDLAAKIHLYHPDGRLVRTVHFVVPDPGGAGTLRPDAVLADGSVFAQPPVTDYAVLVQGRKRVGLSRVSPEGVILGELGWRDVRRHIQEIKYPNGGALHALQPFPGTTLWAVRADGRAVTLVDPEPGGEIPSYRVIELGLSGDTLMDVSHEYEPIAITDEFLEELVSSRYAESEQLQEQFSYARYRAAFMAGLERPENHPPVTQLLAGLDGSLWLRREDLRRESTRWDVLDASRRHVATVRVPANLDVKKAGADHVWGVEQGPLDVPYLVRYRLERR